MSYPFLSTRHPDGNVLQMSNSSRNRLHGCGRRFEFSKFFPAAARDGSFAGDAGNAMHYAFGEYLLTRNRDVGAARLALTYPIRFQKSPFDTRSLEACYATYEALCDSTFLSEYEIAKIVLPNGETKHAIEVPFTIRIPNFQLRAADGSPIYVEYIGYIDFIMYSAFRNEYIVVDLKTTRQRMYDYTPKFAWDDQCLPYGLALEAILGREVTNMQVIYLVAYIDIEQPHVQPLTFNKTQENIEEWAFSLTADLIELRRYYNMGWFPRRSSSCFAYNRTCGYFDMCHIRDPNAIMSIILSQTGLNLNDLPAGDTFEPWFTVDLDINIPEEVQ